MDFQNFEDENQLRQLWNSVSIERTVPYSLFTFGVSDLPYYLVVTPEKPGSLVEISEGEVTVNRANIITPYNAQPEFKNFFEENDFDGMADFLMSRTAAFSHLQIENHAKKKELVSDSVEEVVEKINKRLDDEEEDRIAVLTAPYGLGKLAVLKYTTRRILESAEDNLNELRERGFDH